MTAFTLDHTVLPPTEPLDELVAMIRTASAAEPSTTLSGPDGQHLILPTEVFEVLRDIVEAMAAGQAVAIAGAERTVWASALMTRRTHPDGH